MFTVKEETTLVGISELRTHLNDILNAAKEKNVVLTRRNKPVLAVIDYDRFQQMTELLEEVEDLFLEGLAHQRLDRKDRNTIPLAEAIKKRKSALAAYEEIWALNKDISPSEADADIEKAISEVRAGNR